MHYNKPPPYERPNWASMNEGQRRYAMEQYNLALVRRGHTFDNPNREDDEHYINNFDLDLLGENSQEETQQRSESEEEMAEDTPPQSSDITDTPKRPGGVLQNPAKRLATSGNSSLPGTSGNTDGTGGVGGAGSGSVGINPIPRGINHFRHTFHFKKKWKFLSFGVADQILEDKVGDNTRLALTTSLVNLPWEFAFLYISPAEWNTLRTFRGVHAIKANVKVSQFNPRVAFQTGETTNMTATLNQNKFTRIAIGLRSNANLCCNDRDYAFSTTETMQPISLADVTNMTSRKTLMTAMYGLPNSSAISDHQKNIPAYATGQELCLRQYLTHYISKFNDGGFPPYDNYCTELNSMECLGKEIINQTYHYKYAPLTARAPTNFDSTIFDSNLTNPMTTVVSSGTHIETPLLRSYQLDASAPPTAALLSGDSNSRFVQGPSASKNCSKTFDTPDVMYMRFPMEQSGMYKEMNSSNTSYAAQQSIHMGIRAVPKLTTNANTVQTDSWLDTQMYWTVECELICQASDPFPFIHGGTKTLPTNQQVCIGRVVNDTFIPTLQANDPTYFYGRQFLRDYDSQVDIKKPTKKFGNKPKELVNFNLPYPLQGPPDDKGEVTSD